MIWCTLWDGAGVGVSYLVRVELRKGVKGLDLGVGGGLLWGWR